MSFPRASLAAAGAMILALAAGCGDDDRPMDDADLPDGAIPDGDVPDAGPGGPPGCGASPFVEPTVTQCSEQAPLSSGVCEVTAGGLPLLITGDILTPGEVLAGGQVLVDGSGFIQCVGCDCSGEAGAGDATRIVCPEGVVSPGLINTHDHITFNQASPYPRTAERYEHRQDWRQGIRGHTRIRSAGFFSTNEERSWAELRSVMLGGTSVNGSGGPAGFLRNVDLSSRQEENLDAPPPDNAPFPLGDREIEPIDGTCDYPERMTASEIAGAAAFTPHLAEGIDRATRNEYLCVRDGEFDLIQEQTALIHGMGLLPPDIGEMAVDGAALIWSPRTNITTYGDTARVTEYARLGVQIAIGTDWVITGSMNIGRELACATQFNDEYLNGFFTDEQLWLMATLNGAAVVGMDDVLGLLAPGYVADIAIFDGSVRADHRAVLEAGPQDVALVLRSGVPLYGDAAVVGAIPEGGSCETIDVCGGGKSVCVSREIGIDFAMLTAENGESYDLFFCGEPTDEPSCVPERNASPPFPNPEVDGSNRYTGMRTATDGDGDGIDDAVDNCPCTFNPIRPLDEGAQADFDGDGAGDACDPCPLNANTTDCSRPDASDRDGDMVTDTEDNCPNAPNPDQRDRDGDGKGDACDACPDEANPGTAACPATVYEIKRGEITPGESVSVGGLVVTGLVRNGFFAQADPADPGYDGVEHSGIFVFTGGAPDVSRGDGVELSRATVVDFFGQIELMDVAVRVTGSGLALPDPVTATPAQVATGGTRAAELEGALVRVEDVSVTDIAPPPGTGDSAPTGEFEVDGALRVDDFMFMFEPFPVVDEGFRSITGCLYFRNAHSKLAPRDADDVVAGDPVLSGLAPALSFARVGASGAPTFPEPLTVRLSRPAVAPTRVTLSSSGAGLRVANVTIPAGMSSAVVPVDGVTPRAAPFVVTARLGDRSLDADVRVLGATERPVGVELTPTAAPVVTGGSQTFTVTSDIPAPAGGVVVMLSVDRGGSVPASVTIRADERAATFDFMAGDVEATATITATFDAARATAEVMISETALGTLVINELDYDQPGDDRAEFIELHNATSSAQSLEGLVVVLVNGATNEEYERVPLSGALAGGGFLVLANADVVVAAGAEVIRFSSESNNVQNGAPDAVVLFDPATNTVLDALSYEGAISAAVISGAPGTYDLVEGTATRASDVNEAGVARSLVRLPDGADSHDDDADWSESSMPTPGAPNR